MPKTVDGAMHATLRDRLRGVLAGSEWIPIWAAEAWFGDVVRPLLIAEARYSTDPRVQALLTALRGSPDVQEARAILWAYAEEDDEPS